MKKVSIFWHRRDLRIEDNAGLFHALHGEFPVFPVFIFDKNILSELSENDVRVQFIYKEIEKLKAAYREKGSDLLVFYDKPLIAHHQLQKLFSVQKLFYNRDYEPYALERDNEINQFWKSKGTEVLHFKDHVLMEAGEVLKDDGKPYTVFTPYSKKWKLLFDGNISFQTEQRIHMLFQGKFNQTLISLKNMGFVEQTKKFPEKKLDEKLISLYDKNRDYPGINGTSRLGIHLRFGTLSIRQVAKKALSLNQTFLNELIWRDFYIQIMYYFPHTIQSAFKPSYNQILWRNNEAEFERWTTGQTGIPIVDAGMRELSETGFMHNRVRMIAASYLVKNLLIDWKWGEAWFAEKLLDFELASNNGGWQWVAGSGVDAAPYFRIFNPELQTQKFDPDLTYIKKWVPEFRNSSYPKPFIDHAAARERCIKVYKQALGV
jgi:deoxyribodipyrimidine photo-lyase